MWWNRWRTVASDCLQIRIPQSTNLEVFYQTRQHFNYPNGEHMMAGSVIIFSPHSPHTTNKFSVSWVMFQFLANYQSWTEVTECYVNGELKSWCRVSVLVISTNIKVRLKCKRNFTNPSYNLLYDFIEACLFMSLHILRTDLEYTFITRVSYKKGEPYLFCVNVTSNPKI